MLPVISCMFNTNRTGSVFITFKHFLNFLISKVGLHADPKMSHWTVHVKEYKKLLYKN